MSATKAAKPKPRYTEARAALARAVQRGEPELVLAEYRRAFKFERLAGYVEEFAPDLTERQRHLIAAMLLGDGGERDD